MSQSGTRLVCAICHEPLAIEVETIDATVETIRVACEGCGAVAESSPSWQVTTRE